MGSCHQYYHLTTEITLEACPAASTTITENRGYEVCLFPQKVRIFALEPSLQLALPKEYFLDIFLIEESGGPPRRRD